MTSTSPASLIRRRSTMRPSRPASWSLLGGSAISLGIFIPGPGVVITLGSVVVVWAWYVRSGFALLRLARHGALTRLPATDRPVPTGAAA